MSDESTQPATPPSGWDIPKGVPEQLVIFRFHLHSTVSADAVFVTGKTGCGKSILEDWMTR